VLKNFQPHLLGVEPIPKRNPSLITGSELFEHNYTAALVSRVPEQPKKSHIGMRLLVAEGKKA
jgi:hypothetical protein